eukprot:919510-Pyramimonas_sp.AAC.1
MRSPLRRRKRSHSGLMEPSGAPTSQPSRWRLYVSPSWYRSTCTPSSVVTGSPAKTSANKATSQAPVRARLLPRAPEPRAPRQSTLPQSLETFCSRVTRESYSIALLESYSIALLESYSRVTTVTRESRARTGELGDLLLEDAGGL